MKCPYCGEEIDHVNVYSQCCQKGTLEGNNVVEYEYPDVMDTQDIECSECGTSLLGVVK